MTKLPSNTDIRLIMSISTYHFVKQVVGLTASPGAGSANNVETAAEHILELCANMDAVRISTVRDEHNLAEMMNYIKKATEGLSSSSTSYTVTVCEII